MVAALQGLVDHANTLPYGVTPPVDSEGDTVPFPLRVAVPVINLATSSYETEEYEPSDNEG
jgi:hypothetical protein